MSRAFTQEPRLNKLLKFRILKMCKLYHFNDYITRTINARLKMRMNAVVPREHVSIDVYTDSVISAIEDVCRACTDAKHGTHMDVPTLAKRGHTKRKGRSSFNEPGSDKEDEVNTLLW